VVRSNNKRSLPLYGFNGNNIGSAPWSDKKFRDSAASLGFKVIRYPGGAVANRWDWQNGWFEKESFSGVKAKRANSNKSPYGLGELKLIVDQTNCDVVFVLNMLTRTAEDQIEMLRTSQRLGIPIRYVELGNEVYAPHSKSWKVFNTVTDYGRKCREWISKIKSAFPDAKCAVVGGNVATPQASNWNKTVMQNSAGADAITAHLYVNYRTILRNDKIDFKKLDTELRKRYNSRGFQDPNLPDIWVTEYNIQWAAKENDVFDKLGSLSKEETASVANTWSQSLATIYITSFLTEVSSKTKMILNHNITNTPVFAAIDSRTDDIVKRPNGVGMQLWLKATENMTSAERLHIRDTRGNAFPDNEFVAWHFQGNDRNKLFLVNTSDNTMSLDFSSITRLTSLKFTTHSGNKTSDMKSVKVSSGTLKGSTLIVPAFSVTTITF
jgi:hypothetical protein